MNRNLIIVFGVVAVLLLAVFCIKFEASAIESDLSSRSRVALDETGMDWARVELDGRDSILTGVAPSEDAKADAARIAASVSGVRVVDNQVEVAAEPATVEGIPSVAAPYTLTLERLNEQVTLRGLVPDATAKAELVEIAAERFGADNLSDELQVAPGAPGDWLDVAKNSLEHLWTLEEGIAELRDTELQIRGIAPSDELKNQVMDSIANTTPVTYSARADIDVSLAVRAARCQSRFDELLADRNIQFATGSASIKAESHDLLDALAAAAQTCPEAHILIAGHTDSVGAEDSNLRLSQRRAEKVAAYLTEKNVNSEHLIAKGYGESWPVGDNRTATGRARNRRIELSVQEGTAP